MTAMSSLTSGATVMSSLPSSVCTRSVSASRLAAVDRGLSGQAADEHLRAGAGDLDHVPPARTVDDHRVRLAVAGTGERADVRVEEPDGGAGEVADGDRVGAAERMNGRALDAVDVHHDVAEVAREPYAPAVGGYVDDLGAVAAEEVQQVVAGLALEDVVAVARVPLEAVVAAPAERPVLALVAVE